MPQPLPPRVQILAIQNGAMFASSVETTGEVFRRVLSAAQNSLQAMKAAEGRGFPKIDQKALDLIAELQYEWSAY